MNVDANPTRAGIVFVLIPAVQHCLSCIRRTVTHLMARLDQIAFRLAEKVEP